MNEELLARIEKLEHDQKILADCLQTIVNGANSFMDRIIMGLNPEIDYEHLS